MDIRKARVEDYAYIGALIRNCLDYSCDDLVVRRKLLRLDNDREVVFVAEVDDKVVGYIHGDRFELLYMDSLINVFCLAVNENYRKMGIGSALLDQVEEWARERGAVGLRLNSAMSRTSAHEFYRRKGFDKERDQIRFLKMF
jgi:ribosomal protein S18 acetylase RimI-like enzyme